MEFHGLAVRQTQQQGKCQIGHAPRPPMPAQCSGFWAGHEAGAADPSLHRRQRTVVAQGRGAGQRTVVAQGRGSGQRRPHGHGGAASWRGAGGQPSAAMREASHLLPWYRMYCTWHHCWPLDPNALAPTNPHPASPCPHLWKAQVLYGALVAGPAGPGDNTYNDRRDDYVTNEASGPGKRGGGVGGGGRGLLVSSAAHPGWGCRGQQHAAQARGPKALHAWCYMRCCLVQLRVVFHIDRPAGKRVRLPAPAPQVAIDYNAGFTGALAGLIQLLGAKAG